jgi:tetratricopeptide (TPR) repeat protein
MPSLLMIVPGCTFAYAEVVLTEPDALVQTASAHIERNELEQAQLLARQAAGIYHTLGRAGPEAEALHILGKTHFRSGELRKALETYEQALPLARAAGDRKEEASLPAGISSIHLTAGNLASH